MASSKSSFLLLLLLVVSYFGFSAADWNILKQFRPFGFTSLDLNINLENYCNSWRLNVEVNNIRGFENVPGECSDNVGRYLSTSSQYKSDVQKMTEECTLYLSNSFKLAGDSKDAWIFDVDDTLISTVPYFKDHYYGAKKINVSSLEQWMGEKKAPAIEQSLRLYNHIKAQGIKIFLISSRKEYLRSATVDNLIDVGYHGWSGLILRSPQDYSTSVGTYKAAQRKKLVNNGYRIWAIVSSQWSSLFGEPSPLRIFKLPNPMYYEV